MTIAKEEITGIILAGGRSSRMGKDKGLCMLKDKPLVSYAIQTLQPLCSRLMISANHFPEKYAEFGWPVIRDEIPDIGPMGGIYTCLKKSTTRYNLVLSCDTPFVNTAVFQLLLENVENNQVICPVHDTFLIEPLSGCYHTNILSDLTRSIENKEFKMMQFLKRVRMKTVTIDDHLPFFNDFLFLNVNSPEDLKKAEEAVW